MIRRRAKVTGTQKHAREFGGRRFVALLLIILAVLPFAAAQARVAPLDGHDAIASVEHGLIPGAPVEGHPGSPLLERMSYFDVPGVSIAVIDDYEIAWAKGYGVADRETAEPVDTSTLFQAASISKTVTALAVHRLVDEGRLSLDTPINDILRSWTLPENELTRGRPVTLRMLMSHAGGTTVRGFMGYPPGTPLPTLAQILDGEEPANSGPVRVDIPPGEEYRYSGGGIMVVQQSLIDLVGRPFPQSMNELVLKPLGMSRSTFEQPLPVELWDHAANAHSAHPAFGGQSHVYPELAAAGLWATPTDLARAAVEIQRALRGDEGTLLSKRAAEAMVTPMHHDVAAGVSLDRRGDATYFRHRGANWGFSCVMTGHLEDGYGAVVMTNGDGGRMLGQEVLNAIAHVYDWDEYLPETIRPVEMATERLKEYAGRYRTGPDDAVFLSVGDGCLHHHDARREDAIPLYPVAPDEFRYAWQFEQPATFVRETDGSIERVEFSGDDFTWERLRDDEFLPSELIAAGRFDEAVAAYTALSDVEESRINEMGYLLLADSATVEQAIALFTLNAERHPQSANAWDSLGEGCMIAGDKDQAIVNYEKSLELDPSNDNALRMLEQISQM